ncbi:YrzI family small protein [Falsibacillus albus]|uniref:YrzI family small protein n=1 Tax=Falsibacillus albus TaxID=2478915 RepID=A0A3L7K7K9_9BACI|nr:YrzI family small protein [Falsibacillus albus]RLQ98141.1 YrzI family small protein [Falsibacillus albus]
MTLNILFMTVTIKKRQRSFEELEHQKSVKKFYEQNRDKHHEIFSRML